MGTYGFPGVFVAEDNGLAMSVGMAATAVPVFAADAGLFADKQLFSKAKEDKYFRLDSYLDLKTHADETKFENLGKSPLEEDFSATETNIWFGLRAYFLNGGGACYVCSTDAIEEHIEKMDDATLVVACGLTVPADVSATTFLGKHKLFLIKDGASDAGGQFAASYEPSLTASWAAKKVGATPAALVAIPVSAAVAGVYARVDRERGVWKAPANVTLEGGLTASARLGESGATTGSGAGAKNIIRQTSTGTQLVWGARTSASETESDRWKYIPVRRLFNAVERDIQRTMRIAVFEPNNAITWETVRSAIDVYLHQLWRDGGLQGTTPEQAYSVAVGKGTTMTPEDILAGRMIVQVALAAVRPAEFIVLQFSQNVAQAS